MRMPAWAIATTTVYMHKLMRTAKGKTNGWTKLHFNVQGNGYNMLRYEQTNELST
jgi:hypothetical protein